MDIKRLVDLVEVVPAMRAIKGTINQKRKDLGLYALNIADEVATEWDWGFTTGETDESSVANQATYTLKGKNNDCRDIINVRVIADGADGWTLLVEYSQTDMDELLSNRSADGMSMWTPDGRDANGYPKIKIFAAPSSADWTIRYRYRRNNISISDFPDEFTRVLQSALLSKFLPSYRIVYTKDLNDMIERYAAIGGTPRTVRLGADVMLRNNRIGRDYGY